MSPQYTTHSVEHTGNDPPDPLETWGKTFTGIKPQNIYRFVFQNANNLSANQTYNMETTYTKLAGLQDLSPDCVMIAEAGVNWGIRSSPPAPREAFSVFQGKGDWKSTRPKLR